MKFTRNASPRDGSCVLPGSLRAVIAHPFGGKLVMTAFPGLETGLDGTAVFTPESCHETLCGILEHGARTLHMLVERHEICEQGFTLLERMAAEMDIALSYHPLVDFSVPSAALVQDWQAARAAREATLQAGGALAFGCQYGAGRSGLMAAWTLIEAGLTAVDAIAIIRAQFSEAVESPEQEAWLRAL